MIPVDHTTAAEMVGHSWAWAPAAVEWVVRGIHMKICTWKFDGYETTCRYVCSHVPQVPGLISMYLCIESRYRRYFLLIGEWVRAAYLSYHLATISPACTLHTARPMALPFATMCAACWPMKQGSLPLSSALRQPNDRPRGHSFRVYYE